MKNILLSALFAVLYTPHSILVAQTAVEGYVFEENNRGYLRQVKITIHALPDNIVRAEVESDENGYFIAGLPPGDYRLSAQKDVFFDLEENFRIDSGKVFLKLELRRKPGYLFDITIAEARENPDVVVDAVQGATIEIFNRTQNRPELVLKEYTNAFFQYTFEQGNHYTMMIRKPGFLAKRIEVYVNIKGCILCVDGVRTMTPGITENLTAANTMGTLLSNIELERAKIDKRIQIQNIYYDFDKWDIRPDAAERLDNVVTLMNDNPGLSVELGSHTDSRGDDAYNMALSDKRARSAVAYIVSEGIDSARITAKGYGESQLVNRCSNGVACSEEEHQLNRRTELRITGISGDSLEYKRWPSLEQIIADETRAKAEKQRKKTKPAKKRLPEANNSVPLPELEMPDRAEKALEVSDIAIPPPKRIAGDSSIRAVEADTVVIKMTEIPKDFTGFSVEIAQSDTLLPADAPVLGLFGEIFWQKNADDKFFYFTGKYSSPAKVRRFFREKVRTQHPAGRLVMFRKGVKSYIE